MLLKISVICRIARSIFLVPTFSIFGKDKRGAIEFVRSRNSTLDFSRDRLVNTGELSAE